MNRVNEQTLDLEHLEEVISDYRCFITFFSESIQYRIEAYQRTVKKKKSTPVKLKIEYISKAMTYALKILADEAAQEGLPLEELCLPEFF
jgi:hypothetical protein